jgi:hypothetical protein
MLSRFVDFRWFFIAFFVGIIIVYAMAPPHKIVYRFPSPQNADKIVYSHMDGSCYKFDATMVECNEFGGKVRPQPEESMDIA